MSRGHWRRYAKGRGPRSAAIGRRAFHRQDEDRPLFFYSGGAFVRASAATWWDGLLLRRYLTGVLRQPVLVNGRKAFAFEGARTNYMLHCNDHDNALWTASSVVVAPDEAGDPSGGSQADSLEYDAVSGALLTQINGAIPVSSNAFVSRFLKQKAAFVDDTIQIRVFDHVAGFSNRNIESSLLWQRQLEDFGDNGTPSGSPSMAHRNAIAEDRDLYVFGSQYEIGLFASSLIETLAAAATRAADDLTIANADIPTTFFDAQTWSFQWIPSMSSVEFAAAGDSQVLFSAKTGTGLLFMRYAGGAGGRMRLTCIGGNTDSGELVWSAGDVLTITVNFTSGDMDLVGFTSGGGLKTGAGGGWTNTADIQVGNNASLTAAEYGLLTEPYPA